MKLYVGCRLEYVGGGGGAMTDMSGLIEPLIPALRRYARFFFKEATSADDVVQDTLERVISRWHQRRSDGDTRTWVFTILHNLAVNRLRQTARRGYTLPLKDANEVDVATVSTRGDVLRQRDILAAVNRLPDDQRSVLLLVSVEDLTYAEAARVLDVPIGTVMSRLARARAKLAQTIEEDSAPAYSTDDANRPAAFDPFNSPVL